MMPEAKSEINPSELQVLFQAGLKFSLLKQLSSLLLVLPFGARQTHTKGSGTTLATTTADIERGCSSAFKLGQQVWMNLPHGDRESEKRNRFGGGGR